MTPYYQDEWVTIYHGDCANVLPHLPMESVDVVLTDPPYGVKYVSNLRTARFAEIKGDELLPVTWLKDIARIAKVRAGVYWFASDKSLDETRAALKAAGFGLNTMLIWDKQMFTAGNLKDYGKQAEFIVFGSKGTVKLNGARDGNLLSVPKVPQMSLVHPAEKPIPLLQYLIIRSSSPGEVVLDPFMGSGTTLKAARDLGRKAIGIEIEDRYCEIAVKRIAQEVLDLGA